MIAKLYGRPAVDWVVAAAVTVLLWWPLGVVDRLQGVSEDAQRATYLSAGGLMGILAGFTVTVTFFFATTESKTLERFREDYGRELNRSFIGVFATFVTAAGLVLAAGLAAPDGRAAWMFLAAGCAATTKLARIMIFTKGMLDARYKDTRLRAVRVDDRLDRAS